MHMPIRQLLPSSIRRSVGGVCKEQPRTTKREDVRGGPRCNRLMVLMRGGVMIRGGLRRRDAMCTAGTGEHLSGLGRPSPGHWQRGGQHTQGARHARTRASGRASQGPEGAKGSRTVVGERIGGACTGAVGVFSPGEYSGGVSDMSAHNLRVGHPARV